MPNAIPDPHSERLERSVIGACFVNAQVAADAAKILRPESFYEPAAADVFRAMVEIVKSGKAPDSALVEDALRRAGKWKETMGAAYLTDAIDAIPDSAQVASQIETLLDYQRKREGIAAMRLLAFGLRDGSVDCIDAAARLTTMATKMLPCAPELAPADVLDGLIEGTEVGTVRLPLGELEEWIGPVFPGQKIIVAGLTSVGKTALLVTLWVSCLQRGIPVAYISLEDSAEEIVARATGSLAWLTWGAILARKWGSEDAKNEARRIRDWMRSVPGAISYLPGCTRTELALAVSRAVTKGGARIVIVDYVQAVADDGSSRNQQIARVLSDISRAAKPDAALVVGSQLNRAAVQGGEKPGLHHLRDSGVLEQDARAVILLSQQGEEVNDDNGKPIRRGVLIDVGKNKSGRKGQIQGTLWLRHSCLWTGQQRPAFYLPCKEEEPREPEQVSMPVDDDPPVTDSPF